MSNPESHDGAESPSVVRNNTMDIAVSVILFVVGVVVIFEARRLGAGWTSDGPGAGYFPFYIGLILCISSLGVIYQAGFGKDKDEGTFVNREQLGRVLQILLPASVYVLAVLFVGLYVASAVYITLFMIILGKYSPVRSVLVGVLVNALFFMMFEVWFKVPLYKGMFDPLAFLGY